jgi:steroid 5-alpha reductase family enzyme
MMNSILGVAGLILVYFVLLFSRACRYNNYAIADIGWGVGFIIVALYCADRAAPSAVLLSSLTLLLVTLWGLRLSIHVYFRNKGKPEDFRYLQLRNKWTRFPYLQMFIKMYLVQAILMLIVSTAIIIASQSQTNAFGFYGRLFTCIAVFGFIYESISDYQLVKFKKSAENSGKIMQAGLWRYSRHPNYFGEIVFWWGLSLLIATNSGNYFALISGLTMNLLIVFVSGVPMLEEKYKKNPAYADYIQSTNSLLPWRIS